MPQAPGPVPFEQMLARLEALVRSLEADDLDLENSIDAFEEGVRIARDCHARLDQAERRVEALRRLPDGGVAAEPFAAEEES